MAAEAEASREAKAKVWFQFFHTKHAIWLAHMHGNHLRLTKSATNMFTSIWNPYLGINVMAYDSYNMISVES